MQAAQCEPVSAASTGNSLLPLDTLAATIKARIAAGDKASDKAEEHYKSAGLLLLEAKRRLPLEQPGMRWTAYLVGTCKIQTSRAYELIAIAEDRTSVAEIRANGRERAAKHAAKNKAARSSVTNGQSASPDPRAGRIIKILCGASDSELTLWEAFANERLSQRTVNANPAH